MSKVVGIIQARLGSERLPNKVLLQIPPNSGVSMLERVVRQALLATTLDDVVVVTPDRLIALLCNRWNVKAYMPTWEGRDVLREFVVAATDCEADVVVRLTADCPMIQAGIIDECVEEFLSSSVDICYNTSCLGGDMTGDGYDVEVVAYKALYEANNRAINEEREHVTLFTRRRCNSNRLPPHIGPGRSVNTVEDYKYVCGLMEQGIWEL